MDSTIVIAVISFLGTCVGSVGGILTANKLVEYRLKQLEKKVELHNNAVERLFVAEGHIEELQHDIKDLKNKI
jgi:nitroimidazol reductase NimA-like FMN-containing flavoprotein (pyridoxamine 5'-phosphate oxidase superfamily)